MQIIGEEQIFQTLFYELQVDDEQITPSFSSVWNRAQTRKSTQPNVKLIFVMATASLVACLFLLATWVRSGPGAIAQSAVAVMPASSLIVDTPGQELTPTPVTDRATSRRVAKRLVGRKNEKLPAFRESEIWNVVPFLSWQSPTAMLMQSPADDLLLSLPQLYQSVNEFHSYLPFADK